MSSFETYFEKSVTPPDEPSQGQGPELTPSEQAFLEKHLGADWRKAVDAKGLDKPAVVETEVAFAAPEAEPAARAAQAVPAAAGAQPVQSAPAAVVPAGQAAAPALSDDEQELAWLKSQDTVRLVGFFVGEQEFAVPIASVSEVIRFVEPTRLPHAPDYMAGIINLRGRITPLVLSTKLLKMEEAVPEKDRFIIICSSGDLQVGLTVRAISTMHNAPTDQIEYNLEAKVGVEAGFVRGLLKKDDRLIKILAVGQLKRLTLST